MPQDDMSGNSTEHKWWWNGMMDKSMTTTAPL